MRAWRRASARCLSATIDGIAHLFYRDDRQQRERSPRMSTSAPVTFLDRAELAWAAGFFDGEGSTIARTLTSRPGYHQLNVTVPQSGRDGIPAVLLRFQRVMLGMGHISGPS